MGEISYFSCTVSPSCWPAWTHFGKALPTADAILSHQCPTHFPSVCPPKPGVWALFTHRSPRTESPSRSWGLWCRSPQHGKLAHPRGSPRSAAPRTSRAAPASGTGAGSHKRETPNSCPPGITTMGSNAIVPIAFIQIVISLCSPHTRSLVRKWRRISREVGAQESCPKLKQVNLGWTGMTVFKISSYFILSKQ